MPSAPTRVVRSVISQHAEEAVSLRHIRSGLLGAAQVTLHDLRRHDDRVAAHLDGLLLAGEHGYAACTAALGTTGVGEVFSAAVIAIENGNAAGLDSLFAVSQAVPQAQAGLLSAFGWVSSQYLQVTVKNLLASECAWRRQVGIATCAMHQVDPRAAVDRSVADSDVLLRARGLRVAGQCGRQDLRAACMAGQMDDDLTCRYWAARSAALLGERAGSIEVLKAIALRAGPNQRAALCCVLKITEPGEASALLRLLAQDPSTIRLLVRGTGVAAYPDYLPWLIGQMEDLKLARLAGEAFSFITGLDINYLHLDCEAPENLDSGPNDNPDDDNVAMDEDDGLPWPDPAKLQSWWNANQQRFQPGVRYFMGERVTVEHCKKVLRDGFQRQRIAAAEYLCLLQPGTPLFPTSAPAWRQQRWLKRL